MGIKKGLLAGFAALALSMTAQASEINVGGVVWDPDSGLDFTSNGNTYESFAGQVNDFVTGFGVITQFNGLGEAAFCPSCELTYTFSLQLVSADFVQNTPLGDLFIFTFDNVVFDLWVDDSPDYNEAAPSLAAAQDGDNFLHMVNNGLLVGSAFDIFDPLSVNGSGSGYLDVMSGLAMNNFDTNTKKFGSDMSFTSSFQVAQLDVAGYPLFGSLDLAGDTIPEPSTIALFGLALMGFASRKKLS